MENSLNGTDLLPDRAALSLGNVEKGNHRWTLSAVASPAAANCPSCGVRSTAHHSSYHRHLRDLPIQGRAVELTVRVGRWRCRNPDCKRQIFCQRLKEVTHQYARETKRFGEAVRLIAYALGGRPGERLSRRLGIPVSDDTLLRRVKQVAQARPSRRIPVVGVDEWAWRKGYSGYGTILVDLKRRVVADLLPDRTSASFEKWLQEHPGVRIISRDRDGVYADGGYCGAPRAKQVADRFHLVQNLTKAVQEELEHRRHHLVIPATEFLRKDAIGELVPSRQREARPNPRQKEIRRQRRQQKVELFQMVKGLQAQGMRAFEIVRATKISRGRVDKWLRLAECPPQNKMAPRPGMAEAFREELRRLWERGCQNGRMLLDEVRKLGYIGSYSGLVSLVSEWREEKRAADTVAVVAAWQATEQASPATAAMRQVSPQEAAALLSKPKAMLNERQRTIVEFLKQNPDLVAMRRLVLSFRSILCRGRVTSLRRWIKEAEGAGIAGLSKFVRQLKRDQAAVENAVKHDWSNGPVEGHINRLKAVKRQMYGRAGFELLRSRILPLAA
jgi:transposase